jgi:hypothetical protein
LRSIAAMLGHKSLRMAQFYSDEVDRRKRAAHAVATLEQQRNSRRQRAG